MNMKVNVAAIKLLRERTGAGMMDCRGALEKTVGDVEKAVIILKEQGLLQAQKRKDREAKEGRIFLKSNSEKAAVVRLACETDFVAGNSVFMTLGENCAAMAFYESADEKRLSIHVLEAVSRIKENIVLKSVKILRVNQDERIFSYIHGEGRIAGVVGLSSSDPTAWERLEVGNTGADLALHIAAFGPLYVSRDSVDSRYLAGKESEYLSDAKSLGKPDHMIAGIVRGKLEKHLSQICLLEQGFIREETIRVDEMLHRLRDNGGLEIRVSGFLYERVGH